MTFKDLLRDTLATLRARKLRTALTMFGIGWGIVSITLMVAAGEGLRIGQQKVANGADRVLSKGDPPDMHLYGSERERKEPRGEPGLFLITAGDAALLCQVPLVGSQVDIVEFSGKTGLPLDRHGNLPPGWDKVPVTITMNGPERTLFCPVCRLQCLEKLPVGSRVCETQVK